MKKELVNKVLEARIKKEKAKNSWKSVYAGFKFIRKNLRKTKNLTKSIL